ncbi:class I SAM-dependent methyltransferase [Mesorhizobium sp. M0145]|uniref:hypothetical protein n=1 Tax=Mesorhizobium sp. M0145 TaxID=2956895 RepID=UPI0033393402
MSDHSYADALVASQKVHKRKPADFYPTPHNVTAALMEFLKLDLGTIAWEPACGNGAMADVLGHYLGTDAVWSSDLREDCGYGDAGVNFLTCDVNFKCDWIITNPPFNLAEAFIKRALLIAPNAAFLLKSQYWHAKSRIKLFETHPPAFILPLTWRPAFLEKERGKSPLMDVMWVVWMRDACETTYRLLTRPEAEHEYVEFLHSRFHFESETYIGINASDPKRSRSDEKIVNVNSCLIDILGDFVLSKEDTPQLVPPPKSEAFAGTDLTALLY